jgi:hypothetical protein
MKPASTALPMAPCPGGERGVTCATITLALSMDDCIGNRVSDMSVSLQPRGIWPFSATMPAGRSGLFREASLMHARAPTHASLLVCQLSGAELLTKRSHVGFQLLDAQYILVLDRVKVLTRSTISFTPLARAVSVTSHFGRPAIDAGIDGTTFARSW